MSKTNARKTALGIPQDVPRLIPSSASARKALDWMESLILLEGVFMDEAGQAFHKVLSWLSSKEEENPAKGFRRWGLFWKAVVDFEEFNSQPRAGTLLQDYLLEKLLENPNAFHLKAEQSPLSGVSPSLYQTYLREMDLFLKILKTDWEGEFLKKSGLLGRAEAPSLEGVKKAEKGKNLPAPVAARWALKVQLLQSSSPVPVLVEKVAQHFYQNGFGLFGKFRAFRWEDRGRGGNLVGLESVDPILLSQLVGYQEQRQPLIDNIEAFVAGKAANNALLYGERGTGKSSTVKALLNEYGDKGLRLVEVSPTDLRELHDILPVLRGRKEKFVIFVDDLSFEENETSYKGLKAILEGTLEPTPRNVILIATSNRRHLVKEFFSDRTEGTQLDGEIHGADTVEEKLSLSDRFGLVVSFYSPDQETYFKMVESWAKAEGIKMPLDQLHLKAAQWERTNNSRSGRTARQFINDILGKS
jgi:predicted AAA+ superfamily ATPase